MSRENHERGRGLGLGADEDDLESFYTDDDDSMYSGDSPRTNDMSYDEGDDVEIDADVYYRRDGGRSGERSGGSGISSDEGSYGYESGEDRILM